MKPAASDLVSAPTSSDIHGTATRASTSRVSSFAGRVRDGGPVRYHLFTTRWTTISFFALPVSSSSTTFRSISVFPGLRGHQDWRGRGGGLHRGPKVSRSICPERGRRLSHMDRDPSVFRRRLRVGQRRRGTLPEWSSENGATPLVAGGSSESTEPLRVTASLLPPASDPRREGALMHLRSRSSQNR